MTSSSVNLAISVQGAAQDNSPAAKEDEHDILTGKATSRQDHFEEKLKIFCIFKTTRLTRKRLASLYINKQDCKISEL